MFAAVDEAVHAWACAPSPNRQARKQHDTDHSSAARRTCAAGVVEGVHFVQWKLRQWLARGSPTRPKRNVYSRSCSRSGAGGIGQGGWLKPARRCDAAPRGRFVGEKLAGLLMRVCPGFSSARASVSAAAFLYQFCYIYGVVRASRSGRASLLSLPMPS